MTHPIGTLLLLPAIYLAAVLQTSLADVMQIGRVTPDLLALLAIVWLLATPGPRSVLVAGAIGLVADLIAPGRVGLGMAGFLLTAYGVTSLQGRVNLQHPLPRAFVVGLAAIAISAWTAVGHTLSGLATLPLSSLLSDSVSIGLYTSGISLPLLMILHWLREPPRLHPA